MALSVDMQNLNFSVNGDILIVSAEVMILDDDVEVYRRGISAKGNFNDANIKSILVNKLINDAQYIVDVYKQKISTIQSFYADATTPQDALAKLEAEVEAGITV